MFQPNFLAATARSTSSQHLLRNPLWFCVLLLSSLQYLLIALRRTLSAVIRRVQVPKQRVEWTDPKSTIGVVPEHSSPFSGKGSFAARGSRYRKREYISQKT